MPPDETTTDVHALVQDLLPVLVPSATFDPAGDVIVPRGEGERARFSTRTLVEWCRGQPNPAWPPAVDQWLRAMQEQVDVVPAPSSLAGLGPQLRARMVPRMEPELAASVVHRGYTDDIDLCLIVDYPDRMLRVTKDMLAPGEDEAALLHEAIGSTVGADLLDLDDREHEVGPRDRVRLIAKDNNLYVATALMLVRRFLPDPSPYGALVAVPAGSVLLLYPVTSDRAVGFVAVFRRMNESLFRDAPDPLSTAVYWWHEGTLYPVIFEETEDPQRPQVHLVPALEAVVRSLPRA